MTTTLIRILGPQHRNLSFALATTTFFGVSCGLLFTPYMGIATVSYGMLLTGAFLARRNPKLHGSLMVTGASIDLTLVLFLEFSRDAIAEAVSLQMTLPQQLHIAFSTLAVLLYFPMAWLGWRAYQGSSSTRLAHRRLGYVTLAFRTLGFLLMFSLINHVTSVAN